MTVGEMALSVRRVSAPLKSNPSDIMHLDSSTLIA